FRACLSPGPNSGRPSGSAEATAIQPRGGSVGQLSSGRPFRPRRPPPGNPASVTTARGQRDIPALYRTFALDRGSLVHGATVLPPQTARNCAQFGDPPCSILFNKTRVLGLAGEAVSSEPVSKSLNSQLTGKLTGKNIESGYF